MRRIIIVALCCIVVITLIVTLPQPQSNSEYLRIHIRANSNSDADQDIKYTVRLAVVEYLTPYLAGCKSKEHAQTIVASQARQVEEVIDKLLLAYGFDYNSNVKVNREHFPTRKYGRLELAEGVYDSVIVELGSAQGDNWWCIVYPPLCFVGGEYNGSNSIIFKSKLLEIIHKHFGD